MWPNHACVTASSARSRPMETPSQM
ncbi:hypothetical protein AB0I16_00170 [Streptomyces sp. NPDC050703]